MKYLKCDICGAELTKTEVGITERLVNQWCDCSVVKEIAALRKENRRLKKEQEAEK